MLYYYIGMAQCGIVSAPPKSAGLLGLSGSVERYDKEKNAKGQDRGRAGEASESCEALELAPVAACGADSKAARADGKQRERRDGQRCSDRHGEGRQDSRPQQALAQGKKLYNDRAAARPDADGKRQCEGTAPAPAILKFSGPRNVSVAAAAKTIRRMVLNVVIQELDVKIIGRASLSSPPCCSKMPELVIEKPEPHEALRAPN